MGDNGARRSKRNQAEPDQDKDNDSDKEQSDTSEASGNDDYEEDNGDGSGEEQGEQEQEKPKQKSPGRPRKKPRTSAKMVTKGVQEWSNSEEKKLADWLHSQEMSAMKTGIVGKVTTGKKGLPYWIQSRGNSWTARLVQYAYKLEFDIDCELTGEAKDVIEW